MTKEEREKTLRDAVLSLNPDEIRKAGEKTGHKVAVLDDAEVQRLAAEMVLFYIPNAPKEVLQEALSIISMRHMWFGGF